MMNSSEVMQALYDSEITVKTEPNGCWDRGFRAQFGDDDNGYKGPVIEADTWDELMEKVVEEALRQFPDSGFAQRYRGSAV